MKYLANVWNDVAFILDTDTLTCTLKPFNIIDNNECIVGIRDNKIDEDAFTEDLLTKYLTFDDKDFILYVLGLAHIGATLDNTYLPYKTRDTYYRKAVTIIEKKLWRFARYSIKEDSRFFIQVFDHIINNARHLNLVDMTPLETKYTNMLKEHGYVKFWEICKNSKRVDKLCIGSMTYEKL